MNLSDIITKCYILALIIRDDGERLLLGDGIYEFKSSLQHFAPNIYQNDIVELQGTDGQLLAGQVRRSATQAFDGYIADGTIAKTTTEQSRRRFLAFFRKKHHYKVVYIMPDGTAVKRDRGYIVDAPAVQELYQLYPEYHIGLNFEDPNYYEYDEDSEGEEIPANTALISLANLLSGGLVWDNLGAVSQEKTWLDWENGTTTDGFYAYSNGLAGAPLEFTHLYGNAEQKTLSGKNKVNAPQTVERAYGSGTAEYTVDLTGEYTISGSIYAPNNSAAGSSGGVGIDIDGTTNWIIIPQGALTNSVPFSRTVNGHITKIRLTAYGTQSGSKNVYTNIMLESGSTATPYEEYCGGVPSPNPDYPQEIKTVTGAQTVKITGKNLVNLPQNTALPMDNAPYTVLDFGKDITIANARLTLYLTDAKFDNASGAVVDYLKNDGTHQYRTSGAFQLNDAGAGAPMPINTVFSGAYTTRIANLTFRKVNIYLSAGYAHWAQGTANAQFELGSTATAYEPYQSQSQEINLGKNLLENKNTNRTYAGLTYTVNADGSLHVSGTAGTNAQYYITADGVGYQGRTLDLPAGTYTFHGINENGIKFECNYAEDGASGSRYTYGAFTTTTPTHIGIYLSIAQGTTVDRTFYPMLERGSVATSWSPYFTPIELAKIGTYQDYIWNDDGTWKIHKAIGKVVYTGASGESWQYTSGDHARFTIIDSSIALNSGSSIVGAVMSDYFTPASTDTIYLGQDGAIGVHYVLHQFWISYHACTTVADFKTWLSTHNTTVYYQLANPTDTEITDSELIEQLSATANTYQGVNNLWLTPSGGAQGELSVHYATGSIDVGAGYEWEEGSGDNSNIVNNPGIDRVNPIWKVPGPATNPTLTNITTGQTVSWNGSVASGETLTVDLNNQTAELGGANVFSQLSGDWLALAPGANRLEYSATGATQGCTLEWNGVVG